VKELKNSQNGSVLILVAVSITVFCMMLAFAMDYGLMVASVSELQSAADSAALASAAQLLDEDIITGAADQTDDIVMARDYAESFAGQNVAANRLLLLERNDANATSGGVVVGYIENPLDLSSSFETASIPTYNSVKVRTVLTQQLNGPLALFMGGVSGISELEMEAVATATLEDRISGFSPSANENLMMLPFAAFAGDWTDMIENGGGADNFRVVDGVVSSGSDGIPEITLYPYRYNIAIPGMKGNVGTLFVCDSSGVNTTAVKNQIYDGISKANVAGANGLELTDDGSGYYSQWLPGESWMSSTWHYALRNIKGEPRIMPIYQNAINGSSPPVAMMDDPDSPIYGTEQPEICCGIYQQYEIEEFKAVTVVDSQWPYDNNYKRWTVQPSQVTSSAAIVNFNMPHSGMVYSLSLTR
jgi:Flp pilus assembly protein TadG